MVRILRTSLFHHRPLTHQAEPLRVGPNLNVLSVCLAATSRTTSGIKEAMSAAAAVGHSNSRSNIKKSLIMDCATTAEVHKRAGHKHGPRPSFWIWDSICSSTPLPGCPSLTKENIAYASYNI